MAREEEATVATAEVVGLEEVGREEASTEEASRAAARVEAAWEREDRRVRRTGRPEG